MALILMSHGNMAEETLKSAELIVGHLPETKAIGLQKSDGPETLKSKVKACIEKYYESESVYLIVDLLGGTPGNVAINLTQEYPKMHVLSGLNLPMVIEYANQKFIGSEINVFKLMKEAKAGIVDINEFMRQAASEGDEEDE